MASKTPYIDLAKKILENTTIIDNYLMENKIAPVSFEVDSPLALPPAPEVQMAKMGILDSIFDLQLLTAGPAEAHMLYTMPGYNELGVLSALNTLNFWDTIPLNGTATAEQISEKLSVKLSTQLITRLLRLSTPKHIFAETMPGSGIYKHTSLSALFVKVPAWRDLMGHTLQEGAPSSLRLGEALIEIGETEDSSEAASSKALSSNKEYNGYWQFIENDGEGDKRGWRVKRLASVMNLMSSDPSAQVDHVHGLYDWNGIGEGTIVDIGGSRGHVSFEILSKAPKLKAIVQDIAALQKEWNPPTDLADRVSFQVHDFFTPEPVKGAEVYFMRFILHDWSDKWASKILANIASAMGPNSRILAMDAVLPEPGTVPNTIQKMLAGMDIQMLSLLNGMERSKQNFDELVKRSNSNLKVKAIHSKPDSMLSLVEIILDK